jgi:hypothetical protein
MPRTGPTCDSTRNCGTSGWFLSWFAYCGFICVRAFSCRCACIRPLGLTSSLALSPFSPRRPPTLSAPRVTESARSFSHEQPCHAKETQDTATGTPSRSHGPDLASIPSRGPQVCARGGTRHLFIGLTRPVDMSGPQICTSIKGGTTSAVTICDRHALSW